jgi:hypothetical protein
MTEDRMNASPRLAFYGDDFTGSTDALEVLAFAGLRCALFLSAPTPETLQEFAGFDAIGIAGDSRGMSPSEMDATLPSIFQSPADLQAPIVHYKVCSTFDSSPTQELRQVTLVDRRDGMHTHDGVLVNAIGQPVGARSCKQISKKAVSGKRRSACHDRYRGWAKNPAPDFQDPTHAANGRRTVKRGADLVMHDGCLEVRQ